MSDLADPKMPRQPLGLMRRPDEDDAAWKRRYAREWVRRRRASSTDAEKVVALAKWRAWRQQNAEAQNKRIKSYRAANPDKVSAWNRTAHQKKGEGYRERQKARLAEDPEIRRGYAKRARENNRDWYAAYSAANRAYRRQAMPAWADKRAIRLIYREALRLTEATGIQHHVDHVIPLRGKNVCGLHVESNLQIITAEENRRKHNTWCPD